MLAHVDAREKPEGLTPLQSVSGGATTVFIAYQPANSLILIYHFLLVRFYCATQICIARRPTCYSDVAGWLGVCPSHAGIVSKRLNPSKKSGSPIILVSSDPCADTQFQGEPLQRGRSIHGVGKIGDYRRKLQFISETVRDRPMVTMER